MRFGWIAAMALMLADSAVAEQLGRRTPGAIVLPATEKIGCYWYRQREYCSRYCYWEINGKRYCREREREAHAQGVVEDYVYAPMKLGAEPSGRPRR